MINQDIIWRNKISKSKYSKTSNASRFLSIRFRCSLFKYFNKFNTCISATNNSLNGILLVGFPEKEKIFLMKTLAAENKIPLITQSASLLLKDSRNLNDLLGVEDPIQVLFDKVKAAAPCICFINDIDSIGKQRYAQNSETAARAARPTLSTVIPKQAARADYKLESLPPHSSRNLQMTHINGSFGGSLIENQKSARAARLGRTGRDSENEWQEAQADILPFVFFETLFMSGTKSLTQTKFERKNEQGQGFFPKRGKTIDESGDNLLKQKESARAIQLKKNVEKSEIKITSIRNRSTKNALQPINWQNEWGQNRIKQYTNEDKKSGYDKKRQSIINLLFNNLYLEWKYPNRQFMIKHSDQIAFHNVQGKKKKPRQNLGKIIWSFSVVPKLHYSQLQVAYDAQKALWRAKNHKIWEKPPKYTDNTNFKFSRVLPIENGQKAMSSIRFLPAFYPKFSSFNRRQRLFLISSTVDEFGGEKTSKNSGTFNKSKQRKRNLQSIFFKTAKGKTEKKLARSRQNDVQNTKTQLWDFNWTQKIKKPSKKIYNLNNEKQIFNNTEPDLITALLKFLEVLDGFHTFMPEAVPLGHHKIRHMLESFSFPNLSFKDKNTRSKGYVGVVPFEKTDYVFSLFFFKFFLLFMIPFSFQMKNLHVEKRFLSRTNSASRSIIPILYSSFSDIVIPGFSSIFYTSSPVPDERRNTRESSDLLSNSFYSKRLESLPLYSSRNLQMTHMNGSFENTLIENTIFDHAASLGKTVKNENIGLEFLPIDECAKETIAHYSTHGEGLFSNKKNSVQYTIMEQNLEKTVHNIQCTMYNTQNTEQFYKKIKNPRFLGPLSFLPSFLMRRSDQEYKKQAAINWYESCHSGFLSLKLPLIKTRIPTFFWQNKKNKYTIKNKKQWNETKKHTLLSLKLQNIVILTNNQKSKNLYNYLTFINKKKQQQNYWETKNNKFLHLLCENQNDNGAYILSEYFQLLTKFKKQGITVIAATNNETLLDAALLRPGRFDTILKFKSPTYKATSASGFFHFFPDELNNTLPYEPFIHNVFYSQASSASGFLSKRAARAAIYIPKNKIEEKFPISKKGDLRYKNKDTLVNLKKHINVSIFLKYKSFSKNFFSSSNRIKKEKSIYSNVMQIFFQYIFKTKTNIYLWLYHRNFARRSEQRKTARATRLLFRLSSGTGEDLYKNTKYREQQSTKFINFVKYRENIQIKKNKYLKPRRILVLFANRPGFIKKNLKSIRLRSSFYNFTHYDKLSIVSSRYLFNLPKANSASGYFFRGIKNFIDNSRKTFNYHLNNIKLLGLRFDSYVSKNPFVLFAFKDLSRLDKKIFFNCMLVNYSYSVPNFSFNHFTVPSFIRNEGRDSRPYLGRFSSTAKLIGPSFFSKTTRIPSVKRVEISDEQKNSRSRCSLLFNKRSFYPIHRFCSPRSFLLEKRGMRGETVKTFGFKSIFFKTALLKINVPSFIQNRERNDKKNQWPKQTTLCSLSSSYRRFFLPFEKGSASYLYTVFPNNKNNIQYKNKQNKMWSNQLQIACSSFYCLGQTNVWQSLQKTINNKNTEYKKQPIINGYYKTQKKTVAYATRLNKVDNKNNYTRISCSTVPFKIKSYDAKLFFEQQAQTNYFNFIFFIMKKPQLKTIRICLPNELCTFYHFLLSFSFSYKNFENLINDKLEFFS